MKYLCNWLFIGICLFGMQMFAQSPLTPEQLWSLDRVSALGMSTDGNAVVYRVSTPDIKQNKLLSKTYKVSLQNGKVEEVNDAKSLLKDTKISPDGVYQLYHEKVKVQKILGSDRYSDTPLSNANIYDGLDYRHWDSWNDGSYNHVFVKNIKTGETNDILANELFHSPQQTFGDADDYIWSPIGKVIYVAKKQSGTKAAISTNTDLYEYDLISKTTKNLTASNPGYDTHPDFSPQGHLTWLQMKRDGYEADKNDIIVRFRDFDMNLTAAWDGTVQSFKWSADGKKVYFIAPTKGTLQLFEVNFPGLSKIAIQVKQITDGDFDVQKIVGFSGDRIVLARQDMNQPTELFAYDLKKNTWNQLTFVNESKLKDIAKSKVEKRWVKTTDGKDMLVWVILPPNFDPNKKYPALLYCQGGPQSALTQYYSFRWNFQLMAAHGYVVVAPNRRGMPGHGVEWNEQISKDWGGQVMKDYLSAIDDVAKESWVDKDRLGAVGASYGGYSVFYLAGIHQKRFKTFISHCGVFNLESMYGTTEEVFFTNWDIGGPYWDSQNQAARLTYDRFNPIKLVPRWDTPILIIQGGKDYRVPIGQGQEAFQAAQLRGIKSRFLYFEEENHWVLQPQNALVWQREFFRWLQETL
jgi:dipeptidyl aminopeptidase/acylaminoacyl peptidase